MEKPGASTTQEDGYKKLSKRHRDYWETGKNNELTAEQKKKLKEQAQNAARYSGKDGKYNKDFPRKSKDGKPTKEIDHGKLVSNVKKYVGQGYPNNDNPKVPSPYRSLGHMIDVGGTPENPKLPPDGKKSKEPKWVCHNVANYMAALMRELGYPVREVNMYLSQKGKYNYQSAAIQIWFEGKWHFADPFTCTYDPQAAAEAFNGYTNLRTIYWDGTEPVERDDWGVYRVNPPRFPWKRLKESEKGNDLQKRFYPKETDEQGSLIPSRERYKTFFAEDAPTQERYYTESAQVEVEKSGVAITCKTPNVSIYLMDAQGRITDREFTQIPGSFHIAEGTLIQDDPVGPISNPNQTPPTEPEQHEEWVFFGTQKYSAEWEEIGTHELTLYVLGEAGISVDLEVSLHGTNYPVFVEGIPETITLEEGIVLIPFSVTIDPFDPTFHILFDLLLKNGWVQKESYWPAADTLLAMLQRKGGAQVGGVVHNNPKYDVEIRLESIIREGAIGAQWIFQVNIDRNITNIEINVPPRRAARVNEFVYRGELSGASGSILSLPISIQATEQDPVYNDTGIISGTLQINLETGSMRQAISGVVAADGGDEPRVANLIFNFSITVVAQ